MYLTSVAIIKIEPTDNSILMMLDSDDDVGHIVDLSTTSYFSNKTKNPNPVLVFMDVNKIP